MKLRFLIPLLFVASSDSARLLGLYPLAGKSHHFVFRPILEELASRGHEVVYVTGFPYEGTVPPGILQLDISKEMPPLHSQVNVLEIANKTALESLVKLFEFSLILAPFFVGNPTVQRLIHSEERFDAVLMESYFFQEYQSALVHKFGAVGIETITFGCSAWLNELAGLPDNPSYQLDYKAELTQDMDFFQRVYNCYVSAITTLGGYMYMPRMASTMDRYFNYSGWEARPPLGQLLSNRSLVLTNSHFAVGYPSPLPPHRKEIGGVHIRPSKSLPQKIQRFMDESQNGVIYFSLGSNINVSDPANRRIQQVFMKVFEELPQRVLMKWETEFMGRLPKNVLLGKWLPQQDILAHKNCALFITHGGYLSITEAVHFGVPLVGIPFFADQAKNLFFVEDAGIGKMIRLWNISYDTVSQTVQEVLNNNRYKDEILKRSRIFRDRRHSPVEEAVYWIEYVIKYPNALTPKGASLSFVQLHLLDVWMFVVLVLSLLVFVVWKSRSVVPRLFTGLLMFVLVTQKFLASVVRLFNIKSMKFKMN